MIRILHVLNSLNYGGTETVLMNLYRRIDRSEIQFDFVVNSSEKGVYEQEVNALGGIIFRPDKSYIRNYIGYSNWWHEFLIVHPEYRIVHCHQGSVATRCLHVANKLDRCTIAHSHNTASANYSLRTFLWEINSWPTRFIAKQFLACSIEAGIDRFGKDIVESNRFSVMKNGIDVSRFEFNKQKRVECRKTLGIKDGCFVIGHVGRFTEQKNHSFLVRVFAEVCKIHPDSMLLLVGEGDLENDIRKQVSQEGLADRVIFAGVHASVQEYYCAMDAFCFPSLWEGLGMVVVEAQTSGLPVIGSDALPSVADTGAGLLRRLSVHRSPEFWAKALLSYAKAPRCAYASDAVRNAGYDVSDVALWLQNYYKQLI